MKSGVKFHATSQEFSHGGYLTVWLTSLWEIINGWTYDQHQLKIHQRLTELIVLGILYIPEYCDTPLPAQLFLFFFASSSFFMPLFSCLIFSSFFLFLPKVLSLRGPTVARGLFMRLGDSEGRHKELSTQATGPWAQRWPLKDVCGLHPRHSGPAASDAGSSPHCCFSSSAGLDLFAKPSAAPQKTSLKRHDINQWQYRQK